MKTKNRTSAEQQPATSAFPTKMIEQINIACGAKRSGNFSAWVIEACRRRLTSEKRAYTSIKSDEEWTSRVLPSEQNDIVNSLNYEGIAVIEQSLISFWQWQTACWLCHRLNSLFKIRAVMVISQPPGNNPSYYRASLTAASIALNASGDTLLYTCNYNIWEELIEMLLSIFFTRIRSTEDHQSRLFFIHFVAPCACSSSSGCVITQIFLYEDLSTLALHTSVGCISSRMPAGPHFVTQPILLSENIPNIWHKSSTNTRRSTRLKR